jgi:hypothetical protein
MERLEYLSDEVVDLNWKRTLCTLLRRHSRRAFSSTRYLDAIWQDI